MSANSSTGEANARAGNAKRVQHTRVSLPAPPRIRAESDVMAVTEEHPYKMRIVGVRPKRRQASVLVIWVPPFWGRPVEVPSERKTPSTHYRDSRGSQGRRTDATAARCQVKAL